MYAFDDVIIYILLSVVVVLLVSVVWFLLWRKFYTWYFKIDHRLVEVQKTNQLLTEIRGLLIQSNAVDGVVGNEVYEMAETLKNKKSRNHSNGKTANVDTVLTYDDELPEL